MTNTNISKLILWYRMGLMSADEFLNEINKIDNIEVPYEREVYVKQY